MGVASIPPVPRRLLILASAIAVLSAACSEQPEPQIKFSGSGPEFVPQVADSVGDVGLGDSIGVGADGQPFLSYFGFEQEAEGDTPAPARPVYSPNVPAVQVATVTVDGIWSRGAVAQVSETALVNIPFGPQTLGSLKKLTPTNSNGTALAVGEDGTKNVAWAGNDGIWYAAATDTSSVERVFRLEGEARSSAGDVGRPSLALDPAGTPWVAFSVMGTKAIEIHVASGADAGWTDEIVASVDVCEGCDRSDRTAIGVLGDSLVVAFVDAEGRSIQTATMASGSWRESASIPVDGPAGLSMASTGDTLLLAYYGDGGISVASSGSGAWAATRVSDVDVDAQPTTGNLAPSTGIAVDDQATAYVAWQSADGVHLASGDGSTFEERQTLGTENGVTPDVDVAPDGSHVYVSWYDPEAQDVLMGTLGSIGDLALANPSPIPPPSPPPSSASAECGANGEFILDIVARGTAFDKSCLVGPADQPFELAFDNEDPVATVGAHNVAIFTEQGGDALFEGSLVEGPDSVVYPVEPIEAGTYYFECEIHPTSMFGTFAAITAGKGATTGGGQGAAEPSASAST